MEGGEKGEEPALLVGTYRHWPADTQKSRKELTKSTTGNCHPSKYPVNVMLQLQLLLLYLRWFSQSLYEGGTIILLFLFLKSDYDSFQTCSRENDIMDTQISITQFQQLSTPSQSCFIYTFNIFCCTVLQYLNQISDIILFPFLDV